LARLLAIDWDHDQLRIVAVGASRRGVAVEKTLTWPLGEELTAANGEAHGRKLRDALKAAGIAPAPVVACVGRERVVVKELRYPPVPAAEEPALVRFQAAKELSDLPDDVIIDYAPLSPPGQPGERQALAVALRKSAALGWQALARGLGVKLLALTPRPQALVGAVARAQDQGQASAGETIAVVAVGGKWAELAIIHQGRMLFARSLAVGAGLAGDVKRSLSLFATSSAVGAPSALLVTGRVGSDIEQKLRDTAGVPVQALETLSKQESPLDTERGALSAAIGAAHLWARNESLPINFAAPKQPKATANSGRQTKLVAAAAAIILVVAAFVVGNRVLAGKRATIAELTERKTDLEAAYGRLGQVKLDVDALREWEDTTIPWLDELHDLAARFPFQIGFRVKELSAQPIKRTAKEPYVAQITFTGVGKINQDQLISQLIDSLNADRHLRATPQRTIGASGGNQEFQVKVDVAKQPANRYVTALTLPPRLKAGPADPTAEAEEPPDPPDADPEKGGTP
jgi:Tfp pilus assembly PilM family ATPase